MHVCTTYVSNLNITGCVDTRNFLSLSKILINTSYGKKIKESKDKDIIT